MIEPDIRIYSSTSSKDFHQAGSWIRFGLFLSNPIAAVSLSAPPPLDPPVSSLILVQDNILSFKVLSWNCLADLLALPNEIIRDVPFPHTDAKILTWEYRRDRILALILEHSPDLICLLEVDHFDDFFAPRLREKGYEGFWQKKYSDLSDGPAIFYKSAAFTLQEHKVIRLGKGDSQVAHLMRLESIVVPSESVCFAGTHLKAKLGFEEMRRAQVESLLSELARFNPTSLPTVVVGDFNDEPHSAACAEMTGKRFYSAYDVGVDSFEGPRVEAPWTTWKKRKVELKHTIDYIWLSRRRLRVIGALEVPPDSALPDLTPAAVFPSDHLQLLAEVAITRPQ